MDEKTLTALKGSIKKWEDIVAGHGADLGPTNCPLCIEFYGNEFGKDCSGCPVYEHTGKIHCGGTPYSDFYAGPIPISGHSPEDREELTQQAQAELDFLRSLLPKDAE